MIDLRKIKNDLGMSLVVTLIWILVPLLFSKSSEFLGKDVSMLAFGVLSFYPWVAFTHFLMVLLVAFLIVFIHLVVIRNLYQGRSRLIVFLLMSTFIGLSFLAGLLTYPGYFCDFIPISLHHPLRSLSYVLHGSTIWKIIYGAPLGYLFVNFVRKIFSKIINGTKSKLRIVSLSCFVFISIGIGYLLMKNARESRAEKLGNVLLIAVDSLRYDSLNSESTPNLFRMVQEPEAVEFQDHLVGIPRTFPSWIEIITGKYASETGIRHMFPSLRSRDNIFKGMGNVFQKAGYKTFIISDFAGDIFPRFKAAFDDVLTPSLTVTGMIKMNVTQQFTAFLPFFVQGPLSRYFQELKQSPTLADPVHLQEAALSHISSLKDDRWLGIVFFSTAHFPYAAPEPYYRLFSKSDYKGSYLFKKDPEVKVTGSDFKSEDIAQIRAFYKGSLRAIDDSIGEIEKSLKNQGLWDQTTVVFTADHGEQIYDDKHLQGHGEHLRSEVVLKVPLFIKLPKGHLPKAQKVDSLSQPSDVLPTLMGIMGLQKDDVMSGYDYSNTIYGRGERMERTYAYSETGIWFSRTGAAHFQANRLDYPGISGLLDFDQGGSNEMVLDNRYENIITTAKHRAIMTKDFKLIYMPTPEGVKFELYNRLLDPDNERNLIELEKEKGEAMKVILRDHIQKYENKYKFITNYLVPIN